MDTKMYDYLLKIVVVGDSSVGKSCMLSRFVDKSFDNTYNSTIGVDFKIKTILADGNEVKLQIWDTAGQERFKTLISSYYRGAGVAFLVFDLSNLESFNNLDKWYQEIIDMGSQNVTMILVGCKLDAKRAIPDNDIQQWIDQHNGMTYCKCSSLTGEGVDDVFYTAVSEGLSKEIELKKRYKELGIGHRFNIIEPGYDSHKNSCLSCSIL